MTLEILQTSQKQNSVPTWHDTQTCNIQQTPRVPTLPRHSTEPQTLPWDTEINILFPVLKIYIILYIGKEIVLRKCSNEKHILIYWAAHSSADCGYLNMFIWNLLINISKQLGVYLLQAALKINTSCGKMGRQTLDTILPRVFNCSWFAKSPDGTQAYYSADKTHQVEYDCYLDQGGYHYQCLSND